MERVILKYYFENERNAAWRSVNEILKENGYDVLYSANTIFRDLDSPNYEWLMPLLDTSTQSVGSMSAGQQVNGHLSLIEQHFETSTHSIIASKHMQYSKHPKSIRHLEIVDGWHHQFCLIIDGIDAGVAVMIQLQVGSIAK